jgi:hypothetical protein
MVSLKAKPAASNAAHRRRPDIDMRKERARYLAARLGAEARPTGQVPSLPDADRRTAARLLLLLLLLRRGIDATIVLESNYDEGGRFQKMQAQVSTNCWTLAADSVEIWRRSTDAPHHIVSIIIIIVRKTSSGTPKTQQVRWSNAAARQMIEEGESLQARRPGSLYRRHAEDLQLSEVALVRGNNIMQRVTSPCLLVVASVHAERQRACAVRCTRFSLLHDD